MAASGLSTLQYLIIAFEGSVVLSQQHKAVGIVLVGLKYLRFDFVWTGVMQGAAPVFLR